MKKMILLTIVSVLVLVFILPVVLSLSLKMIPNNVQPGYNPDIRLSIYKARDFTQKFVAKTDNLTAIGLSIRNPNLKNKSDVIFNLYDSGGTLVRTVTISGMNLEDGSFIKFTFPPITGSLGKEFSFTISSPGAGPEETIEVFIINSKDIASGITEYSYLEETHEGGTPIVTYSKPQSRMSTVAGVYSNWFSRLLHLRSQKSD